VSRPAGGFVLWLELPGSVDALALYEQAHRLGLDFVPGPLFSATGRYRNCLRLNAGHAVTAQVESAVRRLGALAS
jgi:DNA-binding transcriptional MocR family regulator